MSKGQKDILILTASAGAGHNSAAEAIRCELLARRPELTIDVQDVLDSVPTFFRRSYLAGFRAGMGQLPWLWGVGFYLSNRRQKPHHGPMERARLEFEWAWLTRLRRVLLLNPPRLIVHTHFLAPGMISRLIGKKELRCPQVVAVTDCTVHRYWYADYVSQYFVASRKAVRSLRQWGIADKRITNSGIAVHPKWREPLDREALLADWKMDADRPVVVLAGGAHFTTGPVQAIAQAITRLTNAQVVVLTGRNETLRAEMDELAERGLSVRGVPMTDRVHELVELASLVVTKAGGISTAECVAKGKPMVFLRPVPGQERGNAEHYAALGAGLIAQRWSDVVPLVVRLLNDPVRLAAMAEASRKADRPATATIAEHLLGMLSRRPG
jgi:processive 1,2-diacylglycerol beta-glucosyltransferase